MNLQADISLAVTGYNFNFNFFGPLDWRTMESAQEILASGYVPCGNQVHPLQNPCSKCDNGRIIKCNGPLEKTIRDSNTLTGIYFSDRMMTNDLMLWIREYIKMKNFDFINQDDFWHEVKLVRPNGNLEDIISYVQMNLNFRQFMECLFVVDKLAFTEYLRLFSGTHCQYFYPNNPSRDRQEEKSSLFWKPPKV